jgi:hypothetical protein
VHAPTEDKCNDVKDSYYKEPEHVYGQFLKYHKDIFFIIDFNVKVG